MKRVRNGDYQNTDVRKFPVSMRDHAGLAAYWGEEAAQCIRAIVDQTSAYPDLDTEHAWRISRVAWYHALKSMF